jgi:hypothetical protein
LLRVQGLNVMSTVEYQMATQMGVFPFLQRWSFITTSLWLWYCICMDDYHYHYGIVCTIITMTLFVCKTMILFIWWGFVMSFTLSYA